MSANNTDDALRRATLRHATQWQMRNASDDLTAQEKAEFLAWLKSSPTNIKEYLTNLQMTQMLPRVLQDVQPDYQAAQTGHDEASNLVSLGLAATSRPRPRVLFRFALAAMVLLAAIGLSAYWHRGFSDIIVPHGDQRTVRLNDGSVVHVNSQSRIRIRFTRKERLIELTSGQGLFSVAKDPERPFRVLAGNVDIVAVGTQFDVYRKPGSTEVTVVEGRVSVASSGAAGSSQAPALLGAGERIKFSQSESTSRSEAVDVREATAWTRREISFRDRPLGEVADEYARYLDVPIRIEDESLRNTPVTGMFDAYEPEPFIAFLRNFEGVQVERTPDAIYVRSRKR